MNSCSLFPAFTFYEEFFSSLRAFSRKKKRKKKKKNIFKRYDFLAIVNVSTRILKENENCRFLEEM